MKQYDDSFLNLVDELAGDEYIGQKPSDSLRSLVMQKAGLEKQPPRLRLVKPLLIAALIATSLLAAAAAYYSVSDAFRGVLSEQMSNGQSRPLSSMSPVVDRSGALLQDTARDQGMEVTVRGVVGDANTVKILIDILDPSGKPLAIEQTDGTLAESEISFGSIRMRTNETKGAPSPFGMAHSFDIHLSDLPGGSSASYGVIDDVPGDNRATIMFTMEQDAVEQLVGNTLYLTLTDLTQYSTLRGTGVGMGKNDLYSLVTAFPATDKSDFRLSGHSMDMHGNEEYYYELMTDSDKQLPLAPGLPDYEVTNAALWNGVLYLRGTCPSPTRYDDVLPNPELRNFATDAYFKGDIGNLTELEESPGRVQWEMTFNGIESMEEIKGFELALDGGDGFHAVRRGEWSFEIPLEFENTSKTISLDKDFTIGNFAMHATDLTLSPYYMRVRVTMEEATREAMWHIEDPIERKGSLVDDEVIVYGDSDWEKAVDKVPAVLKMKDGSIVEAPVGGYGDDMETFSIEFNLQVVIDPAQIESITFGDLVMYPNIS